MGERTRATSLFRVPNYPAWFGVDTFFTLQLGSSLDRYFTHGLRAFRLRHDGWLVLHHTRWYERGDPGGWRHIRRPPRPSLAHVGAIGHLWGALAAHGAAVCYGTPHLCTLYASLPGVERRLWPVGWHEQCRAHYGGGVRTLCAGREPQPRTRCCREADGLTFGSGALWNLECRSLLCQRALRCGGIRVRARAAPAQAA